MALTSASYARFQEPKYVSIDDPEPDTWTHEIQDHGEVPIQVGEVVLGYFGPMRLECEWAAYTHARPAQVQVTRVEVEDRPGRWTDLDEEARYGIALCHELAQAVRRWAATPAAQKALQQSYQDAVEALVQEAAE